MQPAAYVKLWLGFVGRNSYSRVTKAYALVVSVSPSTASALIIVVLLGSSVVHAGDNRSTAADKGGLQSPLHCCYEAPRAKVRYAALRSPQVAADQADQRNKLVLVALWRKRKW